MKSSKSKIVGWVISALLAAFLLFGAAGKLFIDFPDKEKLMANLGWTLERIGYVGYVEIVVAVLFLIPRTAFIGAVLITAYLGGATATHVRIAEPFIFPVLLGVIAWVALGLRDARVFGVAFSARK